MHRTLISLCIAVAMSMACVGGNAQTVKLYKVTDKDGKVSYLDRPPESDGGYVEEKDIDLSTNIMDVPVTSSPPESPGGEDAAIEYGTDGAESAQTPRLSDTSISTAAAAEAEAAAEAAAAAEAGAAASGVVPSAPPLTTIGQ